MGEGEAFVKAVDASSGTAKEPVGSGSGAETLRLRREIRTTRDELDRYVREFERRRREVLDPKLQVRKHPALAIGLGVGILAAAAFAMARRSRRRELGGLRRALSRFGLVPPPEPPTSGRVLGLIAGNVVPIGMAVAMGLLRRWGNQRARSA